MLKWFWFCEICKEKGSKDPGKYDEFAFFPNKKRPFCPNPPLTPQSTLSRPFPLGSLSYFLASPGTPVETD
jgi:hypothetical protein